MDIWILLFQNFRICPHSSNLLTTQVNSTRYAVSILSSISLLGFVCHFLLIITFVLNNKRNVPIRKRVDFSEPVSGMVLSTFCNSRSNCVRQVPLHHWLLEQERYLMIQILFRIWVDYFYSIFLLLFLWIFVHIVLGPLMLLAYIFLLPISLFKSCLFSIINKSSHCYIRSFLYSCTVTMAIIVTTD